MIIDDDSDYQFITEKTLYNTTIIQSEYKKRGELLPYYYYLKNKLFDTAVILHDSVFINKYIDFSVNNYKLIWHFIHNWDLIEDETKMIKVFNDKELLSFYENKQLWDGCFGAMTVITHDFLTKVNSKYDISKLLDYVLTRGNRCSFERVIGCLLQKFEKKETLFGDIHQYYMVNGKCYWSIKFDEKEYFSHLPLIKVWSGR